MCQANGKRLDNWVRLKQTQEYINTLNKYLKIKVIYTKEGTNGGTWGHPSVAIDLAAWISVDFQVWFNTTVVGTLIKTIDFTEFSFNNVDTSNFSGFIYLAQSGTNSWYKIGMSKQPYKRLSQLQVGTPLQLTLIERVFTLDAPKLEKTLHEYYQAYWMRGEWFDLPQQEISLFTKVASELDAELESKYTLSHSIA